MSAHTPGPWFVQDDRIVYHKTFGEIATVWPVEYPLAGERPPNARLIAAAPDLLEALKQLLNDLDALAPARPSTQAIEEAQAAIAKATGAA